MCDGKAKATIPLSPEQIRIGLQLSADRRKAMEDVDFCIEMELSQIEVLRELYGLGPEWVLHDWLEGWQRIDDGQPSVVEGGES